MSEDGRTVSLDAFKRKASHIDYYNQNLVNLFENQPFLTSSSCHIFKHVTLPGVKYRWKEFEQVFICDSSKRTHLKHVSQVALNTSLKSITTLKFNFIFLHSSLINNHANNRTRKRVINYLVSPVLPEGKYPHFCIHTLIGIALQLDSLDKLTLDREDQRGNHHAACLSFLRIFSCHIIVDDQGSWKRHYMIFNVGSRK